MSYVEHSPRRPKGDVGTVAWAFRVLDLPSSATEAECRRVYRKEVLRSHPDRLVGEPDAIMREAEARMQDVNHAWDVLQDHFRAVARRKAREEFWSPFDGPRDGSQRVSFERGYAERPPQHLESIGLGVGSLIALSLAGMLVMGFLYATDLEEQRAPSRGLSLVPMRSRFGARTISEFDSALSTETARNGAVFGP